ncbi:hypothetical protein ACFLT7_00680 [candidate division KSB1 bacterium]
MSRRVVVSALICLVLTVTTALPAAAEPALTALDITVQDVAGVKMPRPVTGGVPIAEGSAPADARFVLQDGQGKNVPLQTSVLANWPDGSVRWVLLDFQADPEASGSESLKLTWASKGRQTDPRRAVKVRKGRTVSAESGDIKITTVQGALFRISDRVDVGLSLTDGEGRLCSAKVETASVETEGKVRSTLVLKGEFQTSDGDRVFSFRMRASVYAGLPQVYIEPHILIDSDHGVIQYIKDLSLEFKPLGGLNTASIGGSPGWDGSPSAGKPVRLFQVDDENYRLEGASGSGSKAPGWVEMTDGKGSVAVALRDYWQQWPKSVQVDPDRIKLGLFPHFQAGAYAHMGPWYKHDYIYEGDKYRLRQGQTRRWQVWIDLSGDGEELVESINAPLIPIPDPAQAIASGEWGYIAPAGSKGMTKYDSWAENLFEAYLNSIREQRDYGAMNWGDWWGERNCNWGNHEYDTPLQILKQYARTGDPKYFYVADQSARHSSEVDVVHFVNPELKEYFSQWESDDYPSRPGMVHEHSIGHVGGFHPVSKIKELYVSLSIGNRPNPYLCLDPFNLGHIFTLGMAHYYLLSGDPWILETLQKIGGNLMHLAEDGEYQFKGWDHVGRVNGWTMLALAGLYKVDPSKRCLAAMRHIADEALVEQDPNCGGWLYQLAPGHCACTTNKHVGEVGFLTSVRLNGLSYYYRLTGDERIPNSVERGITHLNNDTWKDEWSDWRYTSCPATRPSGQIGPTIMSLVNSIRLSDNHEHLRVLRKAWDAKFERLLQAPRTGPGAGKAYSMIMYGSPEAMNLFVNGLGSD